MRRLLDILFWSVIAAAFIGPGTVTSAAKAGSEFGFALAWALLFSTLACYVLQEAAGRGSAATGMDLGGNLRERYPAGTALAWIAPVAVGGIVLGCAAYEAGNVLGAVAGIQLLADVPGRAASVACVGFAGVLLWFSSTERVARILGMVVALMGIAFLATALGLGPSPEKLAAGALRPSIPPGSSVLVLGLVGTTVVPYNLFLGSALARGKDLTSMRIGLAVSIGAGGLVSLAVLVVGTALTGEMEFVRLAAVLRERLGSLGELSLGMGLFAAGLTSAITAPLAAALSVSSLVEATRRRADAPVGGSGDAGSPRTDASPASDPRKAFSYRATWIGVLATGLVFGLSGIKPIPIILLAQAFNGLLLPLAALFLWTTMNRFSLREAGMANGRLANLTMGAVVLVCFALGINGLSKAFAALRSYLG